MLTVLAIIGFVGVVLLFDIMRNAYFIRRNLDEIAKALREPLQPEDHAYSMRQYDYLPPLQTIAGLLHEHGRRLDRMDGALRYLQGYVWETRDRRTIDEIVHPEPSQQWGGTTYADPRRESYDLWRRERDIEEGFHRDVVLPSLERSRAQEKPPAQDA